MATITFTNYNVTLNLSQKRKLKSFLASIFQSESRKAKSVSYIFCEDDYLLELNKKYLQHDTFTDILTFTLSEEHEPVAGEVYISYDRIKENATLHKTEELPELYRVMIHGILHLCGYNDETPEEKTIMTNKEDFYLQRIVSRETKE